MVEESAEGFTTWVVGTCRRKRAAEVTDANEASTGSEVRMFVYVMVLMLRLRSSRLHARRHEAVVRGSLGRRRNVPPIMTWPRIIESKNRGQLQQDLGRSTRVFPDVCMRQDFNTLGLSLLSVPQARHDGLLLVIARTLHLQSRVKRPSLEEVNLLSGN